MGSEVEGPKDSWYRGFEVSTVRFCCGFVVPAFPSVADGSSNRATWVSALSRGVCWAVFCIRHVLRLWCCGSPLLWCLGVTVLSHVPNTATARWRGARFGPCPCLIDQFLCYLLTAIIFLHCFLACSYPFSRAFQTMHEVLIVVGTAVVDVVTRCAGGVDASVGTAVPFSVGASPVVAILI